MCIAEQNLVFTMVCLSFASVHTNILFTDTGEKTAILSLGT